VIVREGKRTPQTAQSVSTAVRRHFITTRVNPAVYREHATDVPGRDPADRIHTAACAYGAATVLLTRNQGDFLAEHGLAADKANPPLPPATLSTGLPARVPISYRLGCDDDSAAP